MTSASAGDLNATGTTPFSQHLIVKSVRCERRRHIVLIRHALPGLVGLAGQHLGSRKAGVVGVVCEALAGKHLCHALVAGHNLH